MIAGQQVICINDKFPLGIEKFYTALPKEGITYTIRDVRPGRNWSDSPEEILEVCLYLVELVNPKSSTPPYPERGFNAERFAPLDTFEPQSITSQPETELVPA